MAARVVRHVVLFKVRKDIPESQIAACMAALKGLKNKIPGILNFHIGSNNSPEGFNRGLEHGFTCDFESAQHRDDYLTHEEHVAVVDQFVRPVLDGPVPEAVCVFDFDLE